ncbi:MAG: rhodanese-like domain-containing protein [Burkholderiales bacterium]|nr:rhodanese-like domain-containing protein [Burkholderiales bacterium]MDE2432854.1 rhodanese-like domain-containing protein [Burkholderiales bacterium]HET8694053.1 rhodanese-like domain-containing protein [Aquabacterium sp.]
MSYVTDNWYWIVTAAASGGMLLWQQLKAGGAGLSPTEAVQLINRDKAVVIDVCEPQEFQAGHLIGAKNIPLGQLGSAKGLPGNKTTALVVVCASGIRSGKAVSQLKSMGYENAQSLRGGMGAWRAANLPVEKA